MSTTIHEKKPIENHWEEIDKQIERNTQERINWKKYLNMSLTKAVAKYRAAGCDADITYNSIINEHPELTTEEKRRLKIGVCARFGEMETAQKATEDEK